jgi:hypothetical protein
MAAAIRSGKRSGVKAKKRDADESEKLICYRNGFTFVYFSKEK